MKPETTVVRRRSTVEGQKVRMKFDEDATIHLMGVLTDLYSNRPLAVLREYATNARDAMLQAGTGHLPVQINLPSPYQPTLTISDQGVGLDAEGIASIYSQYGASTKRNSDEFNGMLGLGCKAALSYSQQFTVVGVKDSIKTVVSVSRDEDGGGDMTIVEETQTDEPNGVTVTIPCKASDCGTFEKLAKDLFQWWEPGTVTIDGQAPPVPDTTKITDRVHTRTVTDQGYGGPKAGRDLIVMGGVPYPCLIDVALPRTLGFVCFVDIGDVTFVPSREALRDTKRTQATLDSLRDEYAREVNRKAQADVDASKTHGEALRKMVKWEREIPAGIFKGLTFKGKAIPQQFQGPVRMTSRHGTLGSCGSYPQIDVSHALRCVYVHNYDPVNFTPTHKKKLLHWLDTMAPLHVRRGPSLGQDRGYDGNRSCAHFVLSEAKFGAPWVEDDWRVDWNVVKELKLPKSQAAIQGTPSFRISGSYDVVLRLKGATAGEAKSGLPAADFPKVKDIVWFHGNFWESRNTARALDKVGATDYLLVPLSRNRIDKFVRDFPKAVKLADYVGTLYDAWKKSIPADVADAMALKDTLSGSAKSGLAKIDATKVKDPDVKRAAKLVQIDTRSHENTGFTFLRDLGHRGTDQAVKAISFPDRYPLVDWASLYYNAGGKALDHTYLYMNAVYEAEVKPAGKKS